MDQTNRRKDLRNKTRRSAIAEKAPCIRMQIWNPNPDTNPGWIQNSRLLPDCTIAFSGIAERFKA